MQEKTDDQLRMEAEAKKRQRNTRIALIGLAILGAISAVAVFAFYYSHFGHMDISKVPANWGPFGDFIGGILNPIVGLFALIGLLWTIYQNQVELSLAREEMGRSSQALEDNNTQSNNRSEIDNTLRLIDIIDMQIIRLLDHLVQWDTGNFSEFKSHLYKPKSNLEKCEYNEPLILQLVLEIEHLHGYLEIHTDITNNDLIEDYYMLRILPIARKLYFYDAEQKETIEHLFHGHLLRRIQNVES